MNAWPTSMQMPTSAPSRSFSMKRHERVGARQLVRDDLERELHAGLLRHLVQRPRRCGARRRGCCPPPPASSESGTPSAPRGAGYGIVCATASAASASRQRLAAALVVGDRVGERLAPLAVDEARADRRVHRVERQARVVEPLGQRAHGDAVVVVEVRPRGEHLDALEAVRRNLDQVLAVEPLVVVQVRRNAKARGAHSEAPRRHAETLILPDLVDQVGQQLLQPAEPRVFGEVGADVVERPRDVLDVDRIAAGRRSDSRTCRAP